MSHRTRACLLILALVWQAAAWLSPLGQAQMTQALANVFAHAQALAHHHHGDDQHHDHGHGHGHGHVQIHDHDHDHEQDASLQLNEVEVADTHTATAGTSTTSAPHHHANEAVQWVGLVPQAGDMSAEAPRSPRISHPPALIASVFLQGPLRPPQALAA